jgi:hypothetical protein
MAIIKVTWRTRNDNRVCPICRKLEGYVWEFDSNANTMTNNLVHPEFGVVWTVNNGSGAHGHKGVACRCDLPYDVDFSFEVKMALKLEEAVKAEYQPQEA